ncbi:phosphorylase family protein [Microvirga alba]|uniref:phosphorylase family protein n=1 Tax=Microvirga alba TaxID=2791025 RepID=UPI002D21AE55|nr:phosphorylase [Microvirga alba]
MTSDLPLPILVVTGLRREARLVAGPNITIIASGGSPGRLRIALDELKPAYRAVISFGIAGGLDPTLVAGDAVVSSGVVAVGARWAAHPGIVQDWARCLSRSRRRVILAEIAGVDAPALTPTDKATLRSATGAAAVDMESHIAAAFAAAHGIPFAAIRTICDPADRALPLFVGEALHPSGSINLKAILTEAVRSPMQLATLPRLAWDASVALSSLERCLMLLGPGLRLTGLSKPFRDIP